MYMELLVFLAKIPMTVNHLLHSAHHFWIVMTFPSEVIVESPSSSWASLII